MQRAVSREGPDNRALVSSCSIIEMQRGIKIADLLVGVCQCLRFKARCREGGSESDEGVGNKKALKTENKAT